MKGGKKLRVIFVSMVAVVLVGAIALASTVLYITKDTQLDTAAFSNPTANLIMLDDDGKELSYASSLKDYTPYEEISSNVKNAFVAVEDKRFFKHNGLDYIRLTRAAINDIKAGYKKEGGSTITQQLAKNSLLSNEKTIQRKLKEAKLATQIEKEYSKEEILTMYLNTIYFGRGIYGITAAAQQIFDTTTDKITLPQAAMLTGIVRSPSAYSPLVSPEKATERMKLVLSVMLKEKYINQDEYNLACQYEYQKPNREYENFSYQNAAIEEAGFRLGISEKEVLSNNYTIYTYMDKTTQSLAEKATSSAEFLPQNSRYDYLAVVADNRTAGISGYSANFDYSPYRLKRMPGSTLKPIISYAPSLDSGYISPASPILDDKTDFAGYSPDNYGGKYLGWITVRKAMMSSSNVASVKLAHQIGIDYASYYANKFGLPLDDDVGLSAALGGVKNGFTPIQMTAAYMTFANGGYYNEAVFIKEIKDKQGKSVYKHRMQPIKSVNAETAYLITDMLKDTAKAGTARKLASLPFEIAAKTGTVGTSGGSKNTDAWNMSYTSQNTICAWYGSITNNAETLLEQNITGGSYPTLLAKYIHSNLSKPKDFAVPDGIISIEIDTFATNLEHKLLLASENTPPKYIASELFDARMPLPDTSTYFDAAIPTEFNSYILEGKIELYFTINTNFKYSLYKVDTYGDIHLADYAGIAEGVFADERPTFGLNTYYLVISDANGEIIGESSRISAVYFKSEDLLP